MITTPAKKPFSEEIIEFLDDVSRILMKDQRSKAYSDVVTLGFWIRKGSILKLKERFEKKDNNIHFGRGIAFHIAPSNVPVNFAYSLVTGLLSGNANIVRVPSKEFAQGEIVIDAFSRVLDEKPELKPYIVLVKYDRDKTINDVFSSIADTRIIWGGDATIAEIRKSPLPPRSIEITFADRFSLAVIDSDEYMDREDKEKVASDFFNDTFLTDQNACTSPRIVVWTGGSAEDAKKVFWRNMHAMVKKKYTIQPIQAVNKLTSSYLAAVNETGIKIVEHDDNLIIRVKVEEITKSLMDYKDNSGYFFEYDCRDIKDLIPLCDDKRCQTIGILGNTEIILPLLESGIRGVDRIVPIGRSLDYDLIWDGYSLVDSMTRKISFG